MILTGKLEVFKNNNGYFTAVIKNWNEKAKSFDKAFVSARLPEGTDCEKGQTLTLDVKEGYLNAVYVVAETPFTKLEINVVECEVSSVFPEKAKKAYKGR